MGQTIECKVIELNRSRNNVVLSRRAVLEEERKEQRQEILDRLQPGLVVEGQISNIVDFGAFVDLDGIDGLIHISELSWSHVNHPSEILYDRRHRQVKVLDIDRDRQRISLGLKQTQEDPWQRVVDTYHIGDELEGDGHQGRHVRRVRRDPRRRRGPRPHLRARPAARREPARDRPAGRRGQGQDPRDRLRAPPPVAVDQARRGPGPSASVRSSRPPRAMPPIWTTCPSSVSPRTCPRAATSHRPRWLRPRSPRLRRRAAEEPAEEEPTAAAEPAPADEEPADAPPEPQPDAGFESRAARRRGSCPARVTHRPAVPFVGLTGGIGAGKSDGARRAGAPRRGDALDRRGRPRALRRARRCATRWSRAGAPSRRPGGRVDRAAVAAPRVRHEPTTARWLESLLWPRVGARVYAWREEARARREPRRRGQPWSRRRCCSRRAGAGLRRDDRRRRRRAVARRACGRARARGRRRAAPPASCPRTKRPQRATYV